MKLHALTLCLLAALCSLCSCEHKELCYDHPHSASVRVTFDWSEVGAHALPEGMRVAFYPVQGGSPWIFDCPGGRDRIVEIPEGEYLALCYNNDTEDIVWSNSDMYDSFTAGTWGAEAPDGTPCRLTPDWICGDHCAGVVDLEDLPQGTETEVPFTPVPMVCTCTFEVNGIRGLQYISGIQCTLSEMVGSLRMADDDFPGNMPETLLFSGKTEGGQIKGGFYTFGPRDRDRDDERAHVFTLFLKSRKGKLHVLEADVTEQIHRVPSEGRLHNIHLIIDFDYDIPEEPIGGDDSGFDPGADEWDDDNQDIVL